MKDKTYEELVDENTALAAHVERLTGALELARDRIEILANIATDHGAYVYAALDIWPEGVAKILAESPTTSLARLKAKWQAEALDFLESRIKPLHQSDNGVQGKGYNMALDDCLACIDMIRRQTKEGGTT